MSYSFSIRAATKAAAKAALAQRMAATAVAQACHARDLVPAINAGGAFIDLLADDESKDVVVNMSGSLMGKWEGSDVVHCENINLSVSAGLAEREETAPTV
jgi:copper(I)-binding protein